MGIFSGIWDTVAGVGNQLDHEKHKATLTGPKDHVERIVKLDRQIGKIMGEFNAAARIPQNVVDGINKLMKDNAASFERVVANSAYQEDQLESLGTWMRGAKKTTQVPVQYLRYEHKYRSPSGGDITQIVAEMKVG